MAGHKKKRRPASHHHRLAKGKSNPGRRRRSPVRMNRRGKRNPAGASFGNILETGVWAAVGAVGSKLLTQLVLSGSNTGIMGYLGNLVAGGVLGFAADKALKNSRAAYAIYVGTAIQVLLRAISDYTPYGQAVALTGVGDYQVSNFVTPQRYVNALRSAQVEIPQGWGGAAAIQSSGVPPSHAVGMSGSIYGGGSIYE